MSTCKESLFDYVHHLSGLDDSAWHQAMHSDLVLLIGMAAACCLQFDPATLPMLVFISLFPGVMCTRHAAGGNAQLHLWVVIDVYNQGRDWDGF